MIDKIYKIRSFDEKLGQILISVEGYHSLISIDLPLDENNNVPIGNDLHLYINGLIPYSWIERTNKLKNPIPNAQIIKDMVEPLPIEPIIENENITQQIINGVDSLPSI